ncbi:MAG: response regulator [Chloroflexota bacterium]|nr:response regulator [Chloroflexota bacterium]
MEGHKKPLVFIVDDDPSARDTLEALLFQENYDLAFAVSGREALTRLAQLAPDVILLDVMMPGMDGFEVCQRIKADERWRYIPVILVTALDTKNNIIRGLDAGADEFLSKPVNGPELRARVRSMLRIKKQFDELEATVHLREGLSHMIVHDMRNPLAVTLMNACIVKEIVTEPEYLERLNAIERETRRLDSFLNDMLMQAKMQENRLILNRSPVDVVQMVRMVREAYDTVARPAGINLVTELPQGECRHMSLDASLFRRVLDNLLSNALKFSPPEGTIVLRVEYSEVESEGRSPQPQMRIQVLDEGPGIAQEHRDRIFDRFEIVSLRKKGVPQVGLGLAFCKLAVEAHGGRISVDANKPRGSVFTVEIWDDGQETATSNAISVL